MAKIGDRVFFVRRSMVYTGHITSINGDECSVSLSAPDEVLSLPLAWVRESASEACATLRDLAQAMIEHADLVEKDWESHAIQ